MSVLPAGNAGAAVDLVGRNQADLRVACLPHGVGDQIAQIGFFGGDARPGQGRLHLHGVFATPAGPRDAGVASGECG